MQDKSNDVLVTSDDDSELPYDLRRAQTLVRYYQRRLEKLENKYDSIREHFDALIKLKASLTNHPAAQNAWDNFVVILRLVDPDAKNYIDKL